MEQARARKSTERATKLEDQDAEVQAAQRASGQLATSKLAELDAVLDEIDEVLEENAEDFVKAYVQKGGE
jgi:ubiquitin-like protein Pup